MKKLTKKRMRTIEVYIRFCANELGLRDWTIQVVFKPSVDDLRNVDDHDSRSDVWGAALDPVRGRKHASVLLGDEVIERLLDGDKEEFRQTVAHELFHCHLAPLWEQLREDLYESRLLPHPAYDLFIRSAERNLEYANDAMADAAAKALPLIDWKKTTWDDMD
jgi:hypothetical protein